MRTKLKIAGDDLPLAVRTAFAPPDANELDIAFLITAPTCPPAIPHRSLANSS
jgi:hypothetical protein